MQHTKIEWVRNPDGSPGYSWNPIKGLCPVGCHYCYARRMYQRFRREPALSWNGTTPLSSHLKPSRIFICSTMEIFHPQIPRLWRNDIFQIIEFPHNRKHTFIILTKMPERIDRPMPDNVWLGVSVTRPDELWRWFNIYQIQKAQTKFISFEPILEQFPGLALGDLILKTDWLVAGRLTGYGHKYDPTKSTLKNIVGMTHGPVFLKNNLQEIWGKPLIQEFPQEPDETIEYDFPPSCYWCEGKGWIVGHDYKKHVCPQCKGKGEEEEDDKN